ncbi:MAG: HEAT repeat domain-containing protein [Planctomycetota bacterium]
MSYKTAILAAAFAMTAVLAFACNSAAKPGSVEPAAAAQSNQMTVPGAEKQQADQEEFLYNGEVPEDLRIAYIVSGRGPWSTNNYTLEIRADGECEYNYNYSGGSDSGSKPNVNESFAIRPEDVKFIWKTIAENKFFGLDKQYDSWACDGSAGTLSIKADDKTHIVTTINCQLKRFDLICLAINKVLPDQYRFAYGAISGQTYDEAVAGKEKVSGCPPPRTKAEIPGFIKQLSDPTPGVRTSAIEALEKLQAKEAIPDLVKMLSDPYTVARGKAAYALAGLQAAQAIPDIIKLLSDPDSMVCRYAIGALERLKAKDAIPAITGLLSNSDKLVRILAVWALGQLQARDAIPAITKLLSDPDEEVRKTAQAVLEKLGSEVPAEKK